MKIYFVNRSCSSAARGDNNQARGLDHATPNSRNSSRENRSAYLALRYYIIWWTTCPLWNSLQALRRATRMGLATNREQFLFFRIGKPVS